ncbi:M48 family metallopeptidase [Neolewinella antarctica]|uniref:YgjP-like metallopeptidase domain-containing protein n=1 Tax=Neolewinella antarctica TaxID=442734 RepID=A0ABX0XFS9_9BACT|nr:SprT family zinc-dependent metalloprotease [Neolewinella antarctica]NJC28178.1 hypothetical protein [Neolewinella antarctica]
MSHQITYGRETITYELQFAERKTVDIAVAPDRRVTVTAPLAADGERVAKLVRKRAAWILKQQRFFLGFEPRTPPRKYVGGETHLYLGHQYRLKIFAAEEPSVKLRGGYFYVGTPDRSATKDMLHHWYAARAAVKFPEIATPYLARFAELGYVPKDLVIRSMQRRWGSCTAKGKLILNTDLVRAPRGCIEYVIVHELCHLAHHNHGKKFQALQAREFPAWAKWKGVLEERMV